jgi:DNA-binding CsgD family transcriptional regulator
MCTSCQAACPAGGLRILALTSLRAQRGDQALARAEAAIAAARQHDDVWEEGLAQAHRAAILSRSGQLASAQSALETALELLSGNNGWGVAHVLYGLGNLARARRDNAAALRHLRSALELFSQLGARTERARCLAGIGWVALATLDLPTAASSLGESLELSMATGQRLGIARGIEALAALAATRGDDASAVRLDSAGAALREVVGQPRPAASQEMLDTLLASARRRLGPTSAVLAAEGRRLSTHEAVSYALATLDSASPYSPPAAANERLTGQAAPAAPSVLTARELQIARLISRGLSNRAIADELVISPATAARHVANILAKLGLNSRAQVAAWVTQQPSAH